MSIQSIVWTLLFCPGSFFASGQTSTMPGGFDTTTNYTAKTYLTSCLTDSRDLIISPARWNTGQWIGAATVTGVTVLLFSQDAAIQQWMQKSRTPALDNVSRFVFEPIGSGLYSLPTLGILYGCGWIFQDKRAKVTALKGVEAFILAGITTQIIKHLTHRHRPNQDIPPDPGLWEGPFHGFRYTSFPSGHAATAFSIATVIATAYQETIWVPVLCYTLASGAAISRIYDNQHWASDVFIGSVIGFGIGKLVMNNTKKMKVLPVSPTGPGISLVYPL